MIRVYLAPDAGLSRSLTRVANGLRRYMPASFTTVDSREEADLIVYHVLGDRQKRQMEAEATPFVGIRSCLRTTEWPNTGEWLPVWRKALGVASYYALPELIRGDAPPPQYFTPAPNHFLHLPLGADPDLFYPVPAKLERGRSNLLLTTGYLDGPESIDLWGRYLHSRNLVYANWVHIGQTREPQATCLTGVSDATMCALYQQTRWVSCLRRIEGFELPGVEGLLCGARPICYNRPHYRDWYGPLADYIEEDRSEAYQFGQIDDILRRDRRVTPEEVAWAKKQFAWEGIAARFWRWVEARWVAGTQDSRC